MVYKITTENVCFLLFSEKKYKCHFEDCNFACTDSIGLDKHIKLMHTHKVSHSFRTSSLPNRTSSLPYTTSSLPFRTRSLPYTCTTNSLPYTISSLPYMTSSLPYATSCLPYSTSSLPYRFVGLPLLFLLSAYVIDKIKCF